MISPSVSVVIPSHNSATFIERALDSILSQTIKDLECIVINDASTDDSPQIVQRYRGKDKRVRLINFRGNSGAAAARNTGLRVAKGKYICFLDADDVMMKDSLELRIRTLEERHSESPRLIGTYCGSTTIDENATETPTSTPSPKLANFVDYLTASGACPFNANQPLFFTNLLQKTGGFDESLAQQGEDYEFWIRILRMGYYLVGTKYNLVCYRTRVGSIVRSAPLLHLANSLRWHSDVYQDASDKSGFDFHHSVAHYRLQTDTANRVFEFIGMELALTQNIKSAVEVARSSLPDYFSLIYRHRPSRPIIERGFLRQTGQKTLKESDKALIDQFLLEHKNRETAESRSPSCSISMLPSHRDNSRKANPDIVFFPHKDYHVWTISLLKDSLDQAGISYGVVDITCHYRDERTRSKAKELDIPIIGFNNWLLSDSDPKLLIAFNDWDPIVRSIFTAAQKAHIATACIVEGIQDYWDADTNQSRNAYRTADTILLPGEFDKRYFADSPQDLVIMGVPRIHHLRRTRVERASEPHNRVLINSNFSYGVLTEHRDKWVELAVESCLEANLVPVISRHPADEGNRYDEYRTSEDFYTALQRCDALITRFASGLLESLAMGIPCVYFNPHGEAVDKFKDPMGAYSICDTKDELTGELASINSKAAEYLKKADPFLGLHCGHIEHDNAARIVEFIKNTLEASPEKHGIHALKKNLSVIDDISGTFSNIKILRERIKATYARTASSVAEPQQSNVIAVRPQRESSTGSTISLKDIHKSIGKGNYYEALIGYQQLIETQPSLDLYKNLAGMFITRLRSQAERLDPDTRSILEHWPKY